MTIRAASCLFIYFKSTTPDMVGEISSILNVFQPSVATFSTPLLLSSAHSTIIDE